MRAKGALVAGLASLCVGCGSLLETKLPESTSYVIAPAPASSTGVTRSEADLSIGRPDLAPGLDTERIAVLKGRQLDYYRGAQWGGRTVEVIQTLLVDSFEDQQLFRSVTPEQSRVSSEYVLDVSVRDFQAEYASDGAAPTAHVTIFGRLIRVGPRHARRRCRSRREHIAAARRQIGLEQRPAADAQRRKSRNDGSRPSHGWISTPLGGGS